MNEIPCLLTFLLFTRLYIYKLLEKSFVTGIRGCHGEDVPITKMFEVTLYIVHYVLKF